MNKLIALALLLAFAVIVLVDCRADNRMEAAKQPAPVSLLKAVSQ